MIRIAITPAACHAICSTLPEDALLWPLQRQDGQCLIHIEAAARLRAMRRPSESYGNVILRLFEVSRRYASA